MELGKLIVAIGMSTAISACSTADMEKFNKVLASLPKPPANAAPAKPNPAVAQPQTVGRAAFTPEQAQHFNAELSKKITNLKLAALVQDASPTTQKVIGMEACFYPSANYAPYGLSAVGEGADGYHFKYKLRHHDNAQCLSVQRMSNWKATALNALSFTTVFVSDQSGESLSVDHEMQKETDGTWLFIR